MFRSIAAICLVLLAVMLGGYALTGSARRADFAYVNSTGINTLDPAQMSWTPDIRVAINIWEGLTTYHPKTTRPIEGVAHFPPDVSDDGLTYTFTLRPDARWSNGDSVTAADFVRGWRRAIEPGTAGDYAFFITDYLAGAQRYYDWRNQNVAVLTALKRLANGWSIDQQAAHLLAEVGISQSPDDSNVDWQPIHQQRLRQHAAELDRRFAEVGLETPDPHTLRVHLRRRCPFFLELCAFATLLPCHQSVELLRRQVGDIGLTPEGLVVYDPQWTKPDYHVGGYPGLITNGPYRPTEWVFKRHLRLEANPYYWDRESLGCDTIDMVVYGDLNTALMAYERGDVDFLPDMSVDYDHKLVELATTGRRPDFHVPVVLATYYYVFNCSSETVRGRPNPFRDARVRKAFALAVDKEVITEKVIGRGDPVSDCLVPVDTIAGYESPDAARHDPAEARRLLADAGYPDGRGMPIVDLLYNTGSQHGKVCQVLANMWQRELGVTVELRGKEAKTFAESKVRQDYMIARAGWYGDYADPTTFLDVFATGNGNNDAGYSNPVYDGLLHQAAAEAEPDRRMELLAQAEAILVRDEFPALPLYQHTNLLAVKPRVRGLCPNPRLTFPFRYVSVD